MIVTFFTSSHDLILACSVGELSLREIERLEWLLEAKHSSEKLHIGPFIGPRKEMVSPWSTNAVEIAENVGVSQISRIELFRRAQGGGSVFDPMLEARYEQLSSATFLGTGEPEEVKTVRDIASYGASAGLAFSAEEITFLEAARTELGRDFTDVELFGFGQINSEHCRHKIFNGTFVINGKRQEKSLFSLIRETSKHAPKNLVSAYRDNVAFVAGKELSQFAPKSGAFASTFSRRTLSAVLSLKAETHNFPTTVEPFYGASTGAGGEIRDRLAGGTGSLPLAGTAVYMTAYPRLGGTVPRSWEKVLPPRKWKYQTPEEILIKASNGASDFGNKFGQPLIAGSVLTFEGNSESGAYGYDRVVMLAGGVGYTEARYAEKLDPTAGDKIVVLGGDNYRIGMAGGSVSSVEGGGAATELELSAVQRANPEMQKRVANVIRALVESASNPVLMIHDHGAGGHMNCFSELVEKTGGKIFVSKLPLGDKTLSVREILSNESQERMGLVVHATDIPLLEQISSRERAPMYVVGEISSDNRFIAEDADGTRPVDLPIQLLFGSSPQTILEDQVREVSEKPCRIDISSAEALRHTLREVFALESVGCKDWLTNKVDRSVTGLVAAQQCVGPRQLPLGNVGVMALEYRSVAESDGKMVPGVATAIGHASVAGIIDAEAGSMLSIAEALTNIVFAPLNGGLSGVSLSANWMWPAKQPGEDARLYHAVESCSRFAVELGIPIPTGKDSLSMTMNYPDGSKVRAPGTVIISAIGAVDDVSKVLTPALQSGTDSFLLYVNFSGSKQNPLGGSAYAQVRGMLGDETPQVLSADGFKAAFNTVNALVASSELLAGHDVSSGGLITTICEMCFAGDCGAELRFDSTVQSASEFLFCEKPGVLLQVATAKLASVQERFKKVGVEVLLLGVVKGEDISLQFSDSQLILPRLEGVSEWFETSMLLDQLQTASGKAEERLKSLTTHRLDFRFPAHFSGAPVNLGVSAFPKTNSALKAAIIREKGTNGDRELAFSLFAAGFSVKDITMSDLMTGRENLREEQFIVFPGGFSNSDVLGAGRGWAGAFRYNANARTAIEQFYARTDTLSLGVCNGCQLMALLDVFAATEVGDFQMQHNESGKFESCFVAVDVDNSPSILLKNLVGSRLGVWVAHGEGRFVFGKNFSTQNIAARYISSDYPTNPNGSMHNAAAISSPDGRHLAIMPHLERSIFSWQWPYFGSYSREEHAYTPWMQAFVSAREWLSRNPSES